MSHMAGLRLCRWRCLLLSGLWLNAAPVAAQADFTAAQDAPAVSMAGAVTPHSILPVDMQSLPQTIGIEHVDRINRFHRLAAQVGVIPPQVDDMQLGAGQVPGFTYPIPVVRLRFEERAFFDFDQATIRADSEKILDLMADNMRRDVPDVQLTILGHTDAIGTDDYNQTLSRRRAASVMQALIARGVNPGQLSSVAVGEAQPVAPNNTEQGRALNRRVEFMISASEKANLTLISKRRVIREYLLTDRRTKPVAAQAAQLTVLKPRPGPRAAPLQLAPVGTVQGKRPIAAAQAARIAPLPDPQLMPIKEFHQAQLNREFEL